MLLFTVLLSYLLENLLVASDDRHPPGALSSMGEFETSPPIFRPQSQALVVSAMTSSQVWTETGDSAVVPPGAAPHNCALCEQIESGACGATPSCVFCERVASASCRLHSPCLRCTVIKNPFFKCTPGEKYMDECDSCRCIDGHSGWCTNQFCHFRALHLYAMSLSD